MNKDIKVHFMGIGGSGIAPIAMIAQKLGFAVTGCDISAASDYSKALIESGIDIKIGHDPKHISDVDIVAVTPAIFDINPNNSELLLSIEQNILMTWQQFAGKYLYADKNLICVTGTHGKSTTTILMGLVLEAGGFDPYVEAGTIYKPWGGGFRLAEDSNYFVCEADEFNCNFLNYSPSLTVINNLEMDHPEFFEDFDQMKNAYKDFIVNMKEPKILIVNEDCEELMILLEEIKDLLTEKKFKVIGYYISEKYDFPFNKEYRGEILSIDSVKSIFNVHWQSRSEQLLLGVTGTHNVANSIGVIGAALELGVSMESIKKALKSFRGINRRLELVGESEGIKVYDDYAHHPTEVSVVLDTLIHSFPDYKIYAVFEPHQVSRVKLFINEFSEALGKADKVIITKNYLGREINKAIDPIDMDLFVRKIDVNKAKYIESFNDVTNYIVENAKKGDVIVVFGAGNSSKLARSIYQSL